MQTLLLPATRSGITLPPLTVAKPSPSHLNFTSSSSTHRRFLFTPSSRLSLDTHQLQIRNPNIFAKYATYNDTSDSNLLIIVVQKLLNNLSVAKTLEATSRKLKRLGSLGFWVQLVLTIISAVILSFSVVITGKISSPATFYATAASIAAAFVSVFWSFGYIRLSNRLRKDVSIPSKALHRSKVENNIRNGIALNLLGMGAAILGMQATVGILVAKALTTSANPYYRSGSNPILALDIFLVQVFV